MDTAVMVIAAFSAAMQVVQAWRGFRDRTKAFEKAGRAYERTRKAALATTQGNRLQRIVPDDILDAMEKRVTNCWSSYKDVLDPAQNQSFREIDNATEALKTCLCRELGLISSLNGSIPYGKLRDWWTRFCQ